MQYVKLSPRAFAPTRGTKHSAGWDLYSAEDVTIPAGALQLIQTHIGFVIPAGMYGRLASRSGLALRHGLEVKAGTIDSDYRAGIGILLRNEGSRIFHVARGTRIAQIIFQRYETEALSEMTSEEWELLKDSEAATADQEGPVRGCGGFGSTGLK